MSVSDLQAVKDWKFLAWDEQLKKEGLLEWLRAQESLPKALACSELPASMHREVKDWFAAQESSLLPRKLPHEL